MAGGIRGRRDPDMSRCAADVMRVFPEVRTDGLRAGVSTGFSTASTQNGASSPAGACDSPASTASIRPAGGRPRNSTRVATTSVCWRLPPLFFASYSRVRRRPSTNTCRPFLRCSAQISSRRAKATIECHSTRSCLLPSLSVKDTSVATLRHRRPCRCGWESRRFSQKGALLQEAYRETLWFMRKWDSPLISSPNGNDDHPSHMTSIDSDFDG